jgi:hypothetical protein
MARIYRMLSILPLVPGRLGAQARPMTNPFIAEALARARHEDLMRSAARSRRVLAVEREPGMPRRLFRRPRWHRSSS